MREEEKRAVAIQVRHVSKEYRLGEIGGKTLQHELQSWWAKKRGKPDPNLPIALTGKAGERFLALSDINLTVYEGETLGIIGRNGAGKSTLLKLLCQITAPTAGSLDIYGRIASVLEVGTGFHGEMTGRENVYMNGSILGMSRHEIDEKMDEIIRFSEIGPFIDTPVKRYSSGMFVKLGFAVAAHLNSEIMVMDEVLAVGDAAFKKKCVDKMREEARERNRTVLYVSHNMQTVRSLCDRCIVLQKGKLIYSGDVDTAIGLYLSQEQQSELSIEYEEIPRESWMRDPAIDLRRAFYTDRSDNHFEKQEPIRFSLEWQYVRDVQKCGLRVELKTMDNEPLGTYAKADFLEGKAGTPGAAEITLEQRGLAPGTYRMVYTFFCMDEFGNNINLECRQGLSFMVMKNDYPGQWDARNWGSYLLDGMTIRMNN